MARKSQEKGRRGERELAALLQQHGYDVRPGEPLNYGTEPDLVGLPMIHCEVKRCQQLRLSEWMRQASDDAEKFGDGAPAVFFRRNREAWRVIMNLPDWLALYERAMSCKCGGRCSAAEAGGDKKSDSAKSLSPKCEKAIEAIHTDKELEKLSGISKGCRCGGHCQERGAKNGN